MGITAMATNGIPIYSAVEGDNYGNAVEPAAESPIQDAQHYWGHAARNFDWHYHSPLLGHATMRSNDTLVGYALDGFPIYGALSDQEAQDTLDHCNGRFHNGTYRYHVRTLEQVDQSLGYCPNLESAFYTKDHHDRLAKSQGVARNIFGGLKQKHGNEFRPENYTAYTHWNYILGCYHGDVRQTFVLGQDDASTVLYPDCYEA